MQSKSNYSHLHFKLVMYNVVLCFLAFLAGSSESNYIMCLNMKAKMTGAELNMSNNWTNYTNICISTDNFDNMFQILKFLGLIISS